MKILSDELIGINVGTDCSDYKAVYWVYASFPSAWGNIAAEAHGR